MSDITLRFYDEEKTITVPNWGVIKLRPYQILAYVSITQRNVDSCADMPIFPAIVDTGCGHCLAIHKDQFEAAKKWGMVFAPMQGRSIIRGFNGHITTARPFRGDAWLHDYSPATVPPSHRVPEVSRGKSIKLFFAQEGITCYGHDDLTITPIAPRGFFRKLADFFEPDTSKNIPHVMAGRLRDENSARLALPHLPLLGLRSLCVNYIDIEIICTPKGGLLRLNQRPGVTIGENI